MCGAVRQPAGVADPDDNIAGSRKLGTAADTGIYDFPITVRTGNSPVFASGTYPLPILPEGCEWSRPVSTEWQPVFCSRSATYGGGPGDPSRAETWEDLDVFAQTGETAPADPADRVSLGDADLVLANFEVIETVAAMDRLGYKPDRIQKLRTSFKGTDATACPNSEWACIPKPNAPGNYDYRPFPCQNAGWTCLAIRPAGWGALMHRWLRTRTIHVSFAVTLDGWAGAGVSSAEAHVPTAEREAFVLPLRSQIG